MKQSWMAPSKTYRRLKLVYWVVPLVGLSVCLLDQYNSGDFRRSFRALAGTQISPEFGFGNHYVTLWVGQPAQPQRLILSLTADVTAFPCEGCKDDCGTQYDPIYDPTLSKSSNVQNCFSCDSPHTECVNDRCSFQVEYDGRNKTNTDTYTAFDAQDNVYFDTSPNIATKRSSDIATTSRGVLLRFHCQASIDNPVAKKALASGFIGMGTNRNSFIQQAFPPGKKVFSLCFREFETFQPEGTSIGMVQLGGIDRDKHDTPLVYVTNVATIASPHTYGVHVRGVYFAKGGSANVLERVALGQMSVQPLGVLGAEGGLVVNHVGDGYAQGNADYSGIDGTHLWSTAVIDSGVPITTLHVSLQDIFEKTFSDITGGLKYSTKGIHITPLMFETLPTILLQIEGHTQQERGIDPATIPGLIGNHDPNHQFDVILAIPPHHYLVMHNGVAVPTIHFGHGPSCIGANALQGYDVVFDLDKERIGFAQRSDCASGLSLPPLVPKVMYEDAIAAQNQQHTDVNSGTVISSKSVDSQVASNDKADQVVSQDVVVPQNLPQDAIVAQQQQQNVNSGFAISSSSTSAEATNEDVVATVAPQAVTNQGVVTVEAPHDAATQQGLPQDILANQQHQNGGAAKDGTHISGSSAFALIGADAEDPTTDQPGKVTEGNTGEKVEGNSAGLGGSSLPSEEIVDARGGLPDADVGTSVNLLGRAGIQAVKYEKPQPRETVMDKGGLWNILGFFVFFLGFAITVVSTRDQESDGKELQFSGGFERRKIGNDDKSVFTYTGASSVYNANSTMGRRKVWPFGLDKEQGRGRGRGQGSGDRSVHTKESYFRSGNFKSNDDQTHYTQDQTNYSRGRDDQSVYSRGGDDQSVYSRGTYYTQDDRTAYTQDDRTVYTHDDRTAYTQDDRNAYTQDDRTYFTQDDQSYDTRNR